jgi:hypothetical protein
VSSPAERFGGAIVVVSGLPRSGTSMLMRLLEAGGVPVLTDDLRPPDEDNPRGYYEFTPVKTLAKTDDKTWLAQAQGRAIKIISYLLPHLPEQYRYKIIFIRRQIPEVLASQKKMIARRGTGTGQLSQEALAATYATHLEQVRRLLLGRSNCDVLYVDHRQALDAPEQVARQICEFLGESLDTAAMAAEVDTRLHRNRA